MIRMDYVFNKLRSKGIYGSDSRLNLELQVDHRDFGGEFFPDIIMVTKIHRDSSISWSQIMGNGYLDTGLAGSSYSMKCLLVDTHVFKNVFQNTIRFRCRYVD